MKVFHITNYRDKCGIADYSEHLMDALAKSGVDSVPLSIRWSEHKYMVREEIVRLYDKLVDSVPEGGVVHVQHEYGYFGGAHGMLKSLQVFGRLLEILLKKNVRVVVTFHSLPPEFIPLTLKNLVSKRRQAALALAWRKKILPAFKSGRCIAICHNKYTGAALVKTGIPRGAVRVLYFPCAENAASSQNGHSPASSNGARAALGIDAASTVLTCFGFISTYKGINTVAAALQYLPDNYVFLLAGDKHPESDDRSLETMLKNSKDMRWLQSSPENKRRIIVTGYVEREKLPAIWEATDIVLSCYDHVASFSMSASLPEGLASGKPVIASLIPAFREVNEMGDCLAMVSPAAPRELALAIERLAGNDAEKTRLVKNAAAYSRTHTWEKFAQETAAIYKEFDGGHGRNGQSAVDA